MRQSLRVMLLLCLIGFTRTASAAPWACPLWPIFNYPYGTLYYASYYETTCDLPPRAAYMLGVYNYPLYCPDCMNMGGGGASNQPAFRGLDKPVSPAYVHQLPSGPPNSKAVLHNDPNVKFITFTGADQKQIHAKVFIYDLVSNVTRANITRVEHRQFAVAMEIEGAPTMKAQKVDCKPLDENPDCAAYSAVIQSTSGPKLPMLVLTAKRAAEQDKVEPLTKTVSILKKTAIQE